MELKTGPNSDGPNSVTKAGPSRPGPNSVAPVAEQFIEVPKIILESVPSRLSCPEPQVDEQTVGIPVPGGGRRFTGLPGFLPEQSSAAPQFSEESISERIVEQNVDTPVSGGGPQGFRPGQVSSASSSSSHSPAGVLEDADESGEGFFSHLSPAQRKCEGHSSARVPGASAHPS